MCDEGLAGVDDRPRGAVSHGRLFVDPEFVGDDLLPEGASALPHVGRPRVGQRAAVVGLLQPGGLPREGHAGAVVADAEADRRG